jgi:TonB-dependent SusC/RagA subfamily outer membrane receptor
MRSHVWAVAFGAALFGLPPTAGSAAEGYAAGERGRNVTDSYADWSHAQQTGTLTGRVIDKKTLQPLASVQIFIPGLNVGTLTSGNGRFILPNVPAGTHELAVQRLGFRPLSRTVTVGANAAAEQNFEMEEEALSLDQIVVTGTAGQARRREVGNTVAQVNVAELTEPLLGVESILQGRAAGVTITSTGGSVGAGSRIRLRGISSVSMGNQPLVYVDGVRIRSDNFPRNRPPVGFTGRGSDAFASPINEINPADIDRIEVIKGPAATTLYGTEAAAGVIQIFTKRGSSGSANWTFEMDQGLNFPRKFAPEPEPYLRLDYMIVDGKEVDMLREGWRQKYALSVGGGSQVLQYFISGSLESEEGILPNDLREQASVRGNFRLQPSQKLTVDWNTSYTATNLDWAPNGNNSLGLPGIAFRGTTSALGATWREDIHKILDWEISDDHGHVLTGITATYTPVQNFTHRLTLGLDRINSDMRNVRPYGFIVSPEGILSNTQWLNMTSTLDYVGSLEFRPTQNLRSTVSVGSQFISETTVNTETYSEGLPGPGAPTVSSGALKQGFEDRSRVVTGGVFGQALLGYKDRYFLTVGLRLDGNSAFGEDFGFQPYPKVSASYVMSDEPWWPDSWGRLKLRGAYGHAGRAPGAFDAIRTWNPVSIGSVAGFYPNQVGNASLGPERSAETELGFDAGFLDDRVSAEFTYFYRKTTDALFPVRQTPSEGFGGSQLTNVGTMQSQGIELSVRGDLIRSEQLTWDAGVTLTTLSSEVLDLGGAPPFSVGASGQIVEGYPAPVIVGTLLTNPDEVAAPVYERDHYFGPNYPTRVVNVSSSLRLPWGITLSARGEYQAGHYIRVSGVTNTTSRTAWPECETAGNGAYDAIRAGRINELTAEVRAYCDARNVDGNYPIYPGDFFRMRDISARFPLPRFGTSVGSATLLLSARNYFGWTNKEFRAFDPEMLGREGLSTPSFMIPENIPTPKSITASIRVSF